MKEPMYRDNSCSGCARAQIVEEDLRRQLADEKTERARERAFHDADVTKKNNELKSKTRVTLAILTGALAVVGTVGFLIFKAIVTPDAPPPPPPPCSDTVEIISTAGNHRACHPDAKLTIEPSGFQMVVRCVCQKRPE